MILCPSRIQLLERHETIIPQELAGEADGTDRGYRGLVLDQEERRRGA